MPSHVIAIRELWDMLDGCLPGYTTVMGDHSFTVRAPGHEAYPSVPLGKHGRARETGRVEVEFGHVRQLARHFKILECGRKHIPLIKH